ncbi:MAG: radical SAM family heme chaperone HemW [Bacteroidales bacterium]|nr:radical SAM family heme chaperone HemW [Bacteroidales bacterium]MCF8344150.1 radical SAM family heme chaperone HemW [Bacteroidales bacterium]MCF8349987.1 radical SAM family heme chaperone HemW [Bacteroidales bacterium]MCF8376729.1 radical SAM family heme chaperone HemW [Bacteroidales bacterium]
MTGIYIHIPFCKQKCHYCNFFSRATLRDKDAFLKALQSEIKNRKDYLNGESVGSIYLGGGTPSLLQKPEIEEIFRHLYKTFQIDADAEITLEANPDDLNRGKLDELKTTPVNRLSIGVQSFHDDDLKYLNRVHNAEQAASSVRNAQDAGFANLTIDLIYGIPGLSINKWEYNLQTFFSMDVPHLSAYSLTVESATALHKLIEKGKMNEPEENESIRHFKMLMERCRKHDFVHYEISNFCREGFYSRHNSLYWVGGNYLGLGPSAHSYNGISRRWNVSSIHKYINELPVANEVFEEEVLSLRQRNNEYIMTSLRTSWGCDLQHIENVFGEMAAEQCLGNAKKFISEQKINKVGNKLFLTDYGKLFADGIAAELFME